MSITYHSQINPHNKSLLHITVKEIPKTKVYSLPVIEIPTKKVYSLLQSEKSPQQKSIAYQS